MDSDGKITVSYGARIVKAIALTQPNGRWLVFESKGVWYAIATVQNKELSIETIYRRKQKRNKKRKEYPWVYLFEVNDFASFVGANGQRIEYTNPTYNLDLLEGLYRPFGNGGGDYQKLEDLTAAFAPRNGEVATAVAPHGFGILTFGILFSENNTSETIQLGIRERATIDVSDGVYYRNMGVLFGANESLSGSYRGRRPIFPDRSYWVRETITPDIINYNFNYNNAEEQDPSDDSRTLITVVFQGNTDIGETGRSYVEIKTEGSGSTSYDRTVYSVTFYPNGGFIDTGYFSKVRNGFVGRTNMTEAQKSSRRAEASSVLDGLDGVYSAPTFTPPNPVLRDRIFSGQQIIDEQLLYDYSSFSGRVPYTVDVPGAENPLTLVSRDNIINNLFKKEIYRSESFLIPEIGERSSGVKSIFCQAGNNKKTLLHQIPSFEAYDAAVSKVGSELEVVLRCGKQYNPALSNRVRITSGNRIISKQEKFYRREWTQTRVYRLNLSGKVLSTQIHNNSDSALNPTPAADEILIDDLNWQKGWLETYADYRTPHFSYVPFPGNFVGLYQRTGIINDLKSGYRTIYSDRPTGFVKGEPSTSVARVLLYTASYGSMIGDKFVYLDPVDLYDPEVEFDYSFTFSTRFFPNPNYSIISALYHGRHTNKAFYQTVDGAVDGNDFIPGISRQKSTLFPKIDLSEIILPEKIDSSDWNTDLDNVLKTRIKAIAYIGN